jgi:hypothetical protein
MDAQTNKKGGLVNNLWVQMGASAARYGVFANSPLATSALTFMAPNPRAREAVEPNRPTNPHSGPGQPGARQRARSAERPAIGPTCTRRLNLAAVLADVASFLELGRSGRTMVRPPRRWCRRASAARYGVNTKQAALKDQEFRAR